MSQSFTLSRRAVCGGGIFAAGVAVMPFSVMAKATLTILSTPLHLRGVGLGQRAILRTIGTVRIEAASSVARSWDFTEATDVSWSMVDGQVVEQRRGQMHVNGNTVTTGPVSEVLCADERLATIATARGTTSLLVTSTTLAPSSVWDILDDPDAGALPIGLSEYRVFKTTQDDSARQVYWTLRSPWLAALGDAQPHTRLIWRGQGQIKSVTAFV